MIKSVLMNMGLSEKEADVYLVMAGHKDIVAGELSKISGESRTHTYDVLNKLMDKGLVSYVIKNSVKFFKVTDPEKLLDFLRGKREEIEVKEKEIFKIIPEIKKMQVVDEDVRMEVLEGKEGLRSLMNDIIKVKKNFVTWGATTKVKDYLPDFFIDKYLNERKRLKIRARQLFTDYYGVLESPLSENRKLAEEFVSPTTTIIYGDKVAIVFWFEIPRVILVKNKELAGSYIKHFELMWGMAGK